MTEFETKLLELLETKNKTLKSIADQLDILTTHTDNIRHSLIDMTGGSEDFGLMGDVIDALVDNNDIITEIKEYLNK